MPLLQSELDCLLSSCRQLPATTVQDEEKYVSESPVLMLMSTVLSLNRRWYSHALPARQYFERTLYLELSPPCLATLAALLTRISQSETDWSGAAKAMWNMNEARKAKALAQLTQYLGTWCDQNCPGITEREALNQWAARTSQRDFVGQIKYLGPRAHEQLLWYIEGTQAVKLDRHIIQFVNNCIGRTPPEAEILDAVRAVAVAMSISPTGLDARIWDYMQGRTARRTKVPCKRSRAN